MRLLRCGRVDVLELDYRFEKLRLLLVAAFKPVKTQSSPCTMYCVHLPFVSCTLLLRSIEEVLEFVSFIEGRNRDRRDWCVIVVSVGSVKDVDSRWEVSLDYLRPRPT